jgi:hypothetical protein
MLVALDTARWADTQSDRTEPHIAVLERWLSGWLQGDRDWAGVSDSLFPDSR